jgi:Tfp pilus assembly protein PilN
MNKVGIELSATRCVLVEAQAGGTGRRRVAADGEVVRVRSFATIPYGSSSPDSLTAELRGLLAAKTSSRDCWVALWGVRSSHHFMMLPPAKRWRVEALARRDARRGGAAAQIEAADATIGVALGGMRESPSRVLQREVSAVVASSADIRASVQPLIDAGFIVGGVTTPGLALCSVARRRRGAVPGAASAYVAILPFAMALAIVRDGLLLFAREITWGYEGEHGKRYPAPLGPEPLAESLSSELRRSFLFFKQSSKQNVSELRLCGSLPDLRALTAPMIRALDVEVETLDSLEGVDAEALPEPAGLFREQMADLRVAWALSADPEPPVNLLPAALRRPAGAHRRRLLVGAGMAAAVVVAALAWSGADNHARAAESEAQDLSRQVSALEARVQRIRSDGQGAARESARQMALTAFDTQGPRIARVLEALARLAPDEVTLRSLTVSPDATSWRLSIAGFATSADPARAQAAVAGFVRGLRDSPYVGAPIRPPSLRIVWGREAAALRLGGAAGQPDHPMQPALASGTAAIEFSVDYAIRK